MLSLGLGSFILTLHFIWHWPEIIVTIYGLLLTIKGIIYLLAPGIGLKSISSVNSGSLVKFKIAGTIMTLAAVFILWNLSIQLK